ncbi:3-octaprenyl-4-hydroxybenzoate carboxy-lyase [Legionella cherrii]|uniref:Flavin prenyltransferase UbiX n=1 Tax=Legionella cherrii TaxID=28084 RepID=A0A0W0SB89_9GAMM|nr:UbiX family flavin prenyltransferase [Legionella cherrii]KTC80712.1 3-octaprenyl-4-hydroxybenzoate carboxy-lyase [Legionella cherrii]
MSTERLIIGITGASGMIYGIRLLELLKLTSIETHLIVSKSAQLTRKYETNLSLTDLKALAHVYHSWNDVGASIASGSFQTLGMIIAPCSMKTLAAIAHGTSDNLIGRAADVTLKERRKLAIMPRESPLHLGHLQNMVSLTQQGAIICPAMPAFYTKPETIDDIVNYSVGRILDLFNIDVGIVERWQG